METKTFKITTQKGRLDKVVSEELALSRSQIQNWLKMGQILVNDKLGKPNYKVGEGDLILVTPPEAIELSLEPENIPLEIVYEDEDVLVVNKPQGMVVHPSPGHPNHTLVNAILYHVKNLSAINDVIRPGIVHRIDKDTSGLLMIAKNDQAHESLAAQLKAKTSQRSYLALVHGIIDNNKGTIDAPIARDPKERKRQAIVEGGRPAVTHFEVVERFERFTLIRCELETGRTHQIRVHLKYIGHPVAGDPLYGPRKTLQGKGQFLHAETLGFKHPRTGKWLTFSVPAPEIFQETLIRLREKD